MTPQFVVSPNDLAAATKALRAVGNPLHLVGKLAGLGSSELRAGIPTWAWMAVAFGVGIYVGVAHWERVESKLGLR